MKIKKYSTKERYKIINTLLDNIEDEDEDPLFKGKNLQKPYKKFLKHVMRSENITNSRSYLYLYTLKDMMMEAVKFIQSNKKKIRSHGEIIDYVVYSLSRIKGIKLYEDIKPLYMDLEKLHLKFEMHGMQNERFSRSVVIVMTEILKVMKKKYNI